MTTGMQAGDHSILEMENRKRAFRGDSPATGFFRFRGIPVVIENGFFTPRVWKDEDSGDNYGASVMRYPYGYIPNTLGTDGDEVDVYIGPNTLSMWVFIVTQMKTPAFVEVDEQKVMLGFNSEDEAKDAYLGQYDDPRFFGSIQTMHLSKFKELLSSRRGSLIKALNELYSSDTLHDSLRGTMDNPTFILKGVAAKATDLAHAVHEDMEKALSASVAASMAKEYKQPTFTIGTQRTRPEHEPPVVPIRTIPTPQAQPLKAEPVGTDCNVCGYVYKSLDGCPKCSYAMSIKESRNYFER